MKFPPSSYRNLKPDGLSLLLCLLVSILPATAQEEAAKPAAAAATEDNRKPQEQQEEQAAAKPKARLFLTNGDKLSGLPREVTPTQDLLFDSDSLRQTARFPVDKVLSISLDNWKKHPNPKTVAKVQLHNRFRETIGDTILGEIKELTAETIKLDTWYGGEIIIKRNMVKSLKIITNSPGNYYGPNSLQEWTLAEDEKAWQFSYGTLISLATGGIGKDVGLLEKSHISFDAAWKTSMRFKFRLYSSDVSENNPDAYYEISINPSYAYLRTRGKSELGARFLGGGRWKQIAFRPEETRAKFDVFVNRKTGMINLYINGLSACTLQSQNPDPANLGTGLSFHSEDNSQIEISGITVTPWNGNTFPKPATAKPKDEGKDSSDEGQAPHKIILNNGDEVPGTVGKVENDSMLIETEYTPIRIPIKRIKSLSLGESGEEPKKYRDDIRAWFHTGGFVTLKLASFKDGRVSGYSQAFGDVSFDLAAFSRIDFHIYDRQATTVRSKIRF